MSGFKPSIKFRRCLLFGTLVLSSVSISRETQAQQNTSQQSEIDQFLNTNEQPDDTSKVQVREEVEPSPKKDEAREEKKADQTSLEATPFLEPGQVANLAKLSPFEDVVVIQRRFLPKTSRFEAFPALGMVVNNPFFTSYLLNGRLGYYFTEAYGLEANVLAVGTSSKQVTDDLEKKRGVTTKTLVTPQFFYGLDFKWSPLYGKLGLLNKKIVPFDTYFLLGMGVTQTNQDQSPTTFHLGTGQNFAINKSLALRWDLGWYFYNITGSGTRTSGSFMDMHLTVGVSFFFPGAKYR